MELKEVRVNNSIRKNSKVIRVQLDDLVELEKNPKKFSPVLITEARLVLEGFNEVSNASGDTIYYLDSVGHLTLQDSGIWKLDSMELSFVHVHVLQNFIDSVDRATKDVFKEGVRATYNSGYVEKAVIIVKVGETANTVYVVDDVEVKDVYTKLQPKLVPLKHIKF
jgi:hypothetical protein